MIIVPSVTMTGLIRSPSTSAALNRPTAAPIPTPISTATMGGKPSAKPMPASVADARTTDLDRQVYAADKHDKRHRQPQHQHRSRLPQDIGGVAGRAEHRRVEDEDQAKQHGRCQHRVARQQAGQGRPAACASGDGGGAQDSAAPCTRRLSRSSSTCCGVVSALILPSRTTRMRSAIASTSARSDDTTMIALPALASASRRR